MSQPESQSVINARAIPQEWDDLLRTGQQVLEGCGYNPDRQAAANMYDAIVDNLSSEQVDTNRYYGFGQMLVNLARRLQDPAVGQFVISSTVKAVSAKRSVVGPAQLLVLDLNHEHASNAVSTLLAQPATGINPVERFVTDALEMQHRYGSYPTPDVVRSDQVLDYHLDHIAEGKSAADNLSLNAFAGIFGLYRAALQQRGIMIGAPAVSYDSTQSSVALADVVDPASLRSLVPNSVSSAAAGLRRDELVEALAIVNHPNGVLSATADGRLSFHSDRRRQELPPQPVIPSILVMTHTERLRCPALMVRGLMSTTAQLAPAIIERLAAIDRVQ